MADSILTRRGLALPLSRDNGGYLASKAGDALAWGDLLTAIFVPAGSRPMRRSFGSRLNTLLLQPPRQQRNDPIVAYVVKNAVAAWCPGTVVDAVASAADGRVVRVLVNFHVAGQPTGAATAAMTSTALGRSA